MKQWGIKKADRWIPPGLFWRLNGYEYDSEFKHRFVGIVGHRTGEGR